MMTATIVDDLTDTTSDKNRECKGQGVANVASGFLGTLFSGFRYYFEKVHAHPLTHDQYRRNMLPFGTTYPLFVGLFHRFLEENTRRCLVYRISFRLPC